METFSVFARVRPALGDELKEGIGLVVDGKSVEVSKGAFSRRFKMTASFGAEDTQADVFEKVVPLLMSTLDGYNASLLCYGQSGSGKTRTMLGFDLWGMASDRKNTSRVNSTQVCEDWKIDPGSERSGILPRSLAWFLEKKTRLEAAGHYTVNLSMSYFEIYNEAVYDLLNSEIYISDFTNLKTRDDFHVNGSRKPGSNSIKARHKSGIRYDHSGAVHITNLREVEIEGVEECMELLVTGAHNRAVAATDMNYYSSRSHTICLVRCVKSSMEVSTIDSESKIYFVDLAGSEKTRQQYDQSRERTKELASINKSLSALGNVINALSTKGNSHLYSNRSPDSSRVESETNNAAFIPYRESKLTRLLQDVLGKHAKTIFVCTLSPAVSCLQESITTLQFAVRASRVQVQVTRNSNFFSGTLGSSGRNLGAATKSILGGDVQTIALVQKFQNEILMLRETIKHLCFRDDIIQEEERQDVKELIGLIEATTHKATTHEATTEGQATQFLPVMMLSLKNQNLALESQMKALTRELKVEREERKNLLDKVHNIPTDAIEEESEEDGPLAKEFTRLELNPSQQHILLELERGQMQRGYKEVQKLARQMSTTLGWFKAFQNQVTSDASADESSKSALSLRDRISMMEISLRAQEELWMRYIDEKLSLKEKIQAEIAAALKKCKKLQPSEGLSPINGNGFRSFSPSDALFGRDTKGAGSPAFFDARNASPSPGISRRLSWSDHRPWSTPSPTDLTVLKSAGSYGTRRRSAVGASGERKQISPTERAFSFGLSSADASSAVVSNDAVDTEKAVQAVNLAAVAVVEEPDDVRFADDIPSGDDHSDDHPDDHSSLTEADDFTDAIPPP